MSADKQLWLLAGGNGAGKSTFYRISLQPKGIPFVNADLIAKELFPDNPEASSYEAAIIAEQMRSRLLAEGKSFCFETVFSHPSKIDFVAQAKANGYEVILIFIHLELVPLNQARISQRVSEGGHSVPEDKVASRIPRTLHNVRQTLPLCDRAYLLDNSSAKNPFRQIACIHEGKVEMAIESMPNWARDMLRDYLI